MLLSDMQIQNSKIKRQVNKAWQIRGFINLEFDFGFISHFKAIIKLRRQLSDIS